jgi:hypothetical protein
MRQVDMQRFSLSMHLRQYPTLCSLMDEIVKEHGVKTVCAELRRIPIWKEGLLQEQWSESYERSGPRRDILPIREGTFRDGMLRVLGLELVSGIDVDLMTLIKGINASDLQELRERTAPVALKALKKQIKTGTTFFIAPNELKDSAFARLAPLITERRAEEVLALESDSFSKVASTYYGFSYLTGTLTSDDKRELTDQGLSLSCSGRRPSYHRRMFPKCSEPLTELLLNTLRARVARPQTQVKGVEALGILGDCRAANVLHSVLRASDDNSVRYSAFWALAAIGDPSSLEVVKRFIGDLTFDPYALNTISTIRHPSAIDLLLKRAMREPPARRRSSVWIHTSEHDVCTSSEAVRLLWRTRDSKAVEHLTQLLKDRLHVETALESLLFLGEEGHIAIRANLPDVFDAVLNGVRYPAEGASSLLNYLPDLEASEEYIDLVARVIRKTTDCTCHEVLNEHPAILHHPTIRTTLMGVLEKHGYVLATLCNLNKLGLLKEEEFEERALACIPSIYRRMIGTSMNKIDFREMASICSTPILYESSLIHEGLAEVIRSGKRPEQVTENLGPSKSKGTYSQSLETGRSTLRGSQIIQDAIADRLSSKDFPSDMLQFVIEDQDLIALEKMQDAVSLALNSIWSGYVPRGDWIPTPEHFLTWLASSNGIADRPAFQSAVVTLLSYDEKPVSVLRHLMPFDGLCKDERIIESISKMRPVRRRYGLDWEIPAQG